MPPFRIALINMPFSMLQLPSLALTQLRACLQETFGPRVRTDIYYIDHEFAAVTPPDVYFAGVKESTEGPTGFGEWVFRQEAFPDLPDNTEEYLRFRRLPESILPEEIRKIREFRRGLGPFIERMITDHELDRCDVVGLTSLFMQNNATFAMARRLKARNPRLVTVMGGANCKSPMGQVIARRVDAIDFVFSGPALVNFPELIRNLMAGDLQACHGMTGVFTSRRLARQADPPTDEIGPERDINQPLPVDFDDYLASFDRCLPNTPTKPMLPFQTSRGCWWGQRSHCAFCGLDDREISYQFMEPELALRQFERLFRYAPRIRELMTTDCIMPQQYLRQVVPRLQTPPGLAIQYEVRANLTLKDLKAMARAGIRDLQPGIESLDSDQLRVIGKGTTGVSNIRFLRDCVSAGQEVGWNLLVGMPGDTEAMFERYNQTLPALFHLPPPQAVMPVRFMRFSPFYERQQDFGLRLRPADFYSYIYPFDEGDLKSIAFYFEDEEPNPPYKTLAREWLPRLAPLIGEWRKRWGRSWRGPRPRLEIEQTPQGPILHDSRGDPVKSFAVTDDVVKLLSALSQPRSLDNPWQWVGDLDRPALERALAWAQDHHLLFSEKGRVVSLVVMDSSFDHDTDAATYPDNVDATEIGPCGCPCGQPAGSIRTELQAAAVTGRPESD